MTQTQTPITGGRFLTTTLEADDVFIREELSEEQRLFGRTAAEFMQREVLPVVDQLYKHDWELTRRLMKKASELDLLRLEIPPAYGGLGLDLISAAYVGEQIAINPSFGGSLGAHTSIGTLPLVYFGTQEQKQRYLPRLASGELIGAYALTEAQSGSDALAARTTATLSADGRHYALNGQKMWITNGQFADLFTIFAKVDGEQFTAFLVERTMGVVSGRDEIKLGLDGSSTTALKLDDEKVPVENLLGAIGQESKVEFKVLNFYALKVGARKMEGFQLGQDRDQPLADPRAPAESVAGAVQCGGGARCAGRPAVTLAARTAGGRARLRRSCEARRRRAARPGDGQLRRRLEGGAGSAGADRRWRTPR